MSVTASGLDQPTDREDLPVRRGPSDDRAGGELGEAFSMGVARAAEDALFEGELLGSSRAALRMACVQASAAASAPGCVSVKKGSNSFG
jgi:hypothetical protein